jgi:hypothetical protein
MNLKEKQHSHHKCECSKRNLTLVKLHHGPPGQPEVGHGDDNPTLEKALITKSEEAIARYFSWQKLLRKARAHVGLLS